jgi:hypothetical protein
MAEAKSSKAELILLDMLNSLLPGYFLHNDGKRSRLVIGGRVPDIVCAKSCLGIFTTLKHVLDALAAVKFSRRSDTTSGTVTAASWCGPVNYTKEYGIWRNAW